MFTTLCKFHGRNMNGLINRMDLYFGKNVDDKPSHIHYYVVGLSYGQAVHLLSVQKEDKTLVV